MELNANFVVIWFRNELNQSVTSFLEELDVPRAISAPPHLDNRWDNASRLMDIRLDDEYERFYQSQIARGKKLPPPLEGRTLYNDLPAFHEGLTELDQILHRQQQQQQQQMNIAAAAAGGQDASASVLEALAKLNVNGNGVQHGAGGHMQSASSYPNLSSLHAQQGLNQSLPQSEGGLPSRMGASTPPPRFGHPEGQLDGMPSVGDVHSRQHHMQHMSGSLEYQAAYQAACGFADAGGAAGGSRLRPGACAPGGRAREAVQPPVRSLMLSETPLTLHDSMPFLHPSSDSYIWLWPMTW